MASVVDKIVHISEERAQLLSRLASECGTTEDALIEKALDILFGLSAETGEEERHAWSALAQPALARVWENDADSVYDDWRTLYGVPQG